VIQTEFYRGLELAETTLRACPADATAAARAEAVHLALVPLFDDTPARADRACSRGCAHCCHFPVGVTFAETMRLVDAIAADPRLTAAVAREHDATIGSTWDALAGRACPLLRDGACAAYANRPLPCRALASSDANACAAALLGPARVPTDDTAFVRGLGAAAALAAELPGGTRELRAALAHVIAAPSDARATAFAAAREPHPMRATE
jgi:hypothetical protein